MTIFHVPDDFPLISLALASPLVQTGDTILVKEGAGQEVVVIPPDKPGIRIVADEDWPDVVTEDAGEVVVSAPAGDDADPAADGSTVSGVAEDETGTDDYDATAIPPEEANPDPDIDSVGEGYPDEPAVPGLAAADDTGVLTGEAGLEPDDVPDSGGTLESGAQERQTIITLTRAGARRVGTGQGSSTPYWVIVHRHR